MRPLTLDSVEISPSVVVAPSTIRELAKAYKASTWFSRLSLKSRVDYERVMLMLVDTQYGKRLPNSITPSMANAMHGVLSQNHGPITANIFCTVWGIIYKFAMTNDWLTINPWRFVRQSKSNPRKQLWSEQQVADIVGCALAQSPPAYPVARGIMLMYDTSQRPGDCLSMRHDMAKKDAAGWYVEVKQKKTGTVVKSAVTDYTAKLCRLGEGSTSEYLIGCKLDLGDFRTDFRKYADTAGLPKELQLRDLRRTALTEAGAGGATEDQMKSMSGHSDRSMLDIYSVTSRAKSLAAQRARNEARKGLINFPQCP